MSIEITAIPLENEGCLTIRRDEDDRIKVTVQDDEEGASVLFSLHEGRRISATLATLLTGP